MTSRTALGVLVMSAALTLTGCSGSNSKAKASPTCPGVNATPSRTVAWSSMYANIYNASDTKGEGEAVATQLKWRGLNVLSVANDPLADSRPVPKYAEIRYGASGRTIALNIAQQIPHANLYQDSRTNPTVDIVIGNKFVLTPRPPAAINTVKVHVYNTTFQSGLAATVNEQLLPLGYKSDAQKSDRAYYPKDAAVIVYDEQGLPDAQRLAMNIKGARLLQDTNANLNLNGTDVRLYLGSLWSTNGGVLQGSSASPSPSTSPAPSCS